MHNTCTGTGFASLRRIFGCLVASVLLTAVIAASQSQHKPGLIRDTDAAEGKDEPPPVETEKAYDPLMAEKIVKIGDFYLKKKNYGAAIQRYLEALQYQPNRVEAFEALGRAYEKQGDTAKAAEVYKDFISKNPDSPKIPEFRAKLARLEKKS